MSRPKGSIIGARPTWTTTATSGIWTLRQAEEMKADGKWPRGPVAPTSLAGTGGDQQVALTWTAPATTHGTITDYLVEYTPAAGSPTVVATGSTAASYTLTGLTNDTEYTIRVAGVNHTRGDWSSSVAVTPVAQPAFANISVLQNTLPSEPTSGTYVWSGMRNDRPYYTRFTNGSASGYIYFEFSYVFYAEVWFASGQLGAGVSDLNGVWHRKFSDAATPVGLTGWSGYERSGSLDITEL